MTRRLVLRQLRRKKGRYSTSDAAAAKRYAVFTTFLTAFATRVTSMMRSVVTDYQESVDASLGQHGAKFELFRVFLRKIATTWIVFTVLMRGDVIEIFLVPPWRSAFEAKRV